jgi:phosphatidylserine decarboxylase
MVSVTPQKARGLADSGSENRRYTYVIKYEF